MFPGYLKPNKWKCELRVTLAKNSSVKKLLDCKFFTENK
jgi:hypothetical protein